MSKNERTSKRVASVAGKWFRRLRKRPNQQRFNLGRKDLKALLGSSLTQTWDRT